MMATPQATQSETAMINYEVGKVSEEFIRRNRFCRGKRSGKKYRCGNNIDDSRSINEITELIIETINRMLKWRIWDDWWINAWKEEWLKARSNVELSLRGKYSDKVINAILGLINKYIKYINKLKEYWLRNSINEEIKRLIEDLVSGKAEVIIRKNNGISIYGGHITLEIDKPNENSVTIQLRLKGLKGMKLKVPNIFRWTLSKDEYRQFINELIKALRGGFAITDENIHKGKPAMSTTQIWQVITWSLLYPGTIYVNISGIKVNENNISILWFLITNDYNSIKNEVLKVIEEINKEVLPAFMLTAVLGDGSALIRLKRGKYNEPVIRISMSTTKYNAWKQVLNKLGEIGVKWDEDPYESWININFYGSNAIDLAKAMINSLPRILRDILNAFNAEKWTNIRNMANMKLKFRRGEMQIVVAGFKFTVIAYNGTTKLVLNTKDPNKVKRVLDALKREYGEGFIELIHVYEVGKRLSIVIPMYVFERYDDIRIKVIEVLCKKYEKVDDERRKQIIIENLKRLIKPTEDVCQRSDSGGK